MTLTQDEARYVAAEQGITEATGRIAQLSRILGRSNNRDLFTDDSELEEWRRIRAECLAETERIEAMYAEPLHV